VIDELTVRFADRLYRDGRVIFDQFSLQDLGDVLGFGRDHKYQVMGMAVGHPVVPPELPDLIRKVVQEIGADLVDEMGRAIDDIGAPSRDRPPSVGAGGPAGW
jgi:hypothetical protein